MTAWDSTTLDKIRQSGMRKLLPERPRIAVGSDTCGIGMGADKLSAAFDAAFAAQKIPVFLTKTGCFGFCAEEAFVNVHLPGKPLIIFNRVTTEQVDAIVSYVANGVLPTSNVLCRIESWDHLTGPVIEYGKGFPEVPLWNEVPFFKGQKKVVLRDCGIINPGDIEEYIAVGGYRSLYRALHDLSAAAVLDELKKSNLRGRGGAGFPTWKKWEFVAQAAEKERYVICNADEGDPGAYMNRNEIESDPHMLIEGMIIGGYVMAASTGIMYVRAEYPLAVRRLRHAVEQARSHGIIGKSVCGSSFSFDIHIVEGAGAFVCGEETALIASLESNAGRPRVRPPYPAAKGYLGKPTNINNVETWCNVPVIVAKGGEWFTTIGTSKSSGTKVFSLVGKIKNTGLVELPLGTPLQTVVHDIGGGTGTHKKIKAVQTGGPSGGCIPATLFSSTVDYESLAALGAIMGSGGIVVMDEDNCMVDVARYFTSFAANESCGKCAPCREGVYQSKAILNAITSGKGSEADIDRLSELNQIIRDTALCGLGQTAPNPVLTTIRYFRNEYEAHIRGARCDSLVCKPLITYTIDSKNCTGCTLCAKKCPAVTISGEPKKTHRVIQSGCIKCGMCFTVCKFDAVARNGRVRSMSA